MTLPAHAEIVVIGGGIIGCSTAYHLARDHKADVVLLEQGKLTSGSTWHAAGLVGQLRSSASITRVLKYSVDLYKGLEAETGLATGWKMTGCLRLATNADRWIEYKRLATTAKSFGMDMQLLSPAEVKTMWPLLEAGDLVGASWLPTDGQASPSDITQSLAKGARMHGARLFEDVRVTGFDMKDGRITAVKTNKGDIACGKVVNCAGQWARQVGALAGINVPLQPVKHQYIVTERIDGLATDAPTIRDPDRRIYFKEEVGGLVMGGYEPNPQAWTTDLPGGDVPDDWEFRLFDDDYDHFEQHMNQAIARVPALETVGVKQMINGPESFTPDGNFILGVAPECANMFVGAGFNAFGIAAGGGAGWVLAQWVVDGEAPLDLWVVDIRRFSDLHRDRQWVRDRTLEAYGKHYTIGFPHEEYVMGRPQIVSPLYERLQKHRAVFGSKLGWERPNWFAPEGVEPKDIYSMGRQNWFAPVGDEHRHVRENVGIFDQSSFAKYEMTGADALKALDWICANDIAKPVGRLTYTQLLNTRGGIEADLTVARLGEERFYVVTGTGFRTHDFSWIGDHVGNELDVTLTDVTEDYGTLSLMGPRARDVLAAVTDADVSNTAFPFGHVREISIAGHTVRALRVTYVGELGWELHMPIAATGEIFDALMRAGEKHGIRPVGYRALESLRLEKGYRAWGSDITPNDTPQEAGLGWAVKLRKNTDFLGRRALEEISGAALKKRFAGFTVEDREIVLLGRETILRNSEPVGYLTSGGYGYTVGKNIGYGYVRNADGVSDDFLASGDYELVVALERTPAKIHIEPLYDPAGARIRA
ncbi:MAG: FAD-dependent oxidoreductase [Mesorhizobium sp.]|uniref:GcvT family protein n=1 Tax=unclassified Mesorhizobium TaxID=325217 RepID=UPI000FEA361B|nr:MULTISPECIES: FAD-dependent oxidoreductase [unclassified Mesorhizobium]RWB33811.1 MAG: FAD-dependent oxidoreductase [Mesorhizobium sp.]RWB65339.1 MAG: FAD-dependent oxidoreductase [Mesorhizobium sp.]RWC10296.1 MAG: FAD-dependent oxidoreductase [Mesorhizobium sp.]RWD16342.1 MAG: FAD-dependent oxidoreductase [Mesorhizobium sp.]TGT98632.1 FAD-dependent oxidoreductase [Mesorhizobium sp. M5C.F.Ca.ET.164.01.1.1]